MAKISDSNAHNIPPNMYNHLLLTHHLDVCDPCPPHHRYKDTKHQLLCPMPSEKLHLLQPGLSLALAPPTPSFLSLPISLFSYIQPFHDTTGAINTSSNPSKTPAPDGPNLERPRSLPACSSLPAIWICQDVYLP